MANWANFNGEEVKKSDTVTESSKDEWTKNSFSKFEPSLPDETTSSNEPSSANSHRSSREKVSPLRTLRSDPEDSKNDERLTIILHDESRSSGYENGYIVTDTDTDTDEQQLSRILGNASVHYQKQEQDQEPSGSQIRREAREELARIKESSKRGTSKRPDSLCIETTITTTTNTTTPTATTKASCQKLEPPCPIKPSTKRTNRDKNNAEMLVNGETQRDSSKPVHHVQFMEAAAAAAAAAVAAAAATAATSENKPQPSPSISTSSSSSSDDNSSIGYSEARPPDGGWGWVVVAASFMVNLIADGITFSFGVIYVEFLEYFGEGKSKTSWIGSLFMAMPLLSGPVASFLTDRYGCRRVSIAGSILATAGFVISSFASSMELLIFTFGVVAGFGLSLCFVAAVVIVAYYFDKKRSFATGLSVCGSGIGTFIFAPVTRYLLDEYGWRGTTLILAGLFFNLAVCGCLMRDLEWTTIRAKAKTAERRANRVKKRTRIQSSSADSFSASSSANTATQTPHGGGDSKRNFASTNAMIIESLRLQDEEEGGKLFSSLVTLPTFVKNGEKVPLEVLELLSTRKNVYNVLLQNYPSLLISSRSFSDSGALNEGERGIAERLTDGKSAQAPLEEDQKDRQAESGEKNWQHQDAAYLGWLKKINPDSPLKRSATLESTSRRSPTAYLKDIRVHRHSLTYRGAMLNINRYRLRASSCPDIYRNSMMTIAKTKLVWYAGLWEFWDLLVDMLDFSHFADSRFLLFSISNFLLHTWYDVPYIYLTDNAIEMGFSETDASILISVIGIMNMTGEVRFILFQLQFKDS